MLKISLFLWRIRPLESIFYVILKRFDLNFTLKNVRHIWVDGGITASKFLEEGLVDELTIHHRYGFRLWHSSF